MTGEQSLQNVLPEGLSDSFELLEILKSGKETSLAIVYDKICQRKAVLKSGSPELIENEARILARISCAGNYPALYGCFEYKDKSCLLRSFIKGKLLSARIKEKEPLKLKEIINIGIKLCDELSILHNMEPPVIHRDIKPENIILTPEGRVVIIDLGISREFNPGQNRDTQVMGTPSAAPPEQFGFGQTDKRSDIYSAGLVLRDMYKALYAGNGGKGLAAVIKRCTEFAPDKRYSSACELKNALVRLKNRSYIGMAAALSVCVIFGLGVYMTNFGGNADALLSEKSVPTSVVSDDISDKYYTFADDGIEQEVCRILGKKQGTVTKDDLKEITKIVIVGDTPLESSDNILCTGASIIIGIGTPSVSVFGEIKSLEDLAYMENLTEAVICNQHISDLSPLKELGLRKLMLHGNEITDISPLENNYMLEWLDISANPVSDLSPCAKLKRLRRLNVGNTNISTLKDIEKIQGLREFEIHDCDLLEDTSGLENMKLQFLTMRPVSAETLNRIAKIEEMRDLYIWQATELNNLKPLSRLTELRVLYTDYCGLETLEGIENFPMLNKLTISMSRITELGELEKTECLNYVSLAGIPAEDYTVFEKMPEISEIICDSRQYELFSDDLKGRVNIQLEVRN